MTDPYGKMANYSDFRRWLADEGRIPHSPSAQRKARPSPAAKPAAERGRPNVLWLMADQLRWDTFGFMRHSMCRTPHLDQLAAQGMVFDRSYCAMGVCVPSRASFFTGQYLYRHGALNNHYRMKPGRRTFPEFFRDAGYRTANFGKHHCGRPSSQVWEYQDSFQDVLGATAPTRVPFQKQCFSDAVYFGYEKSDNPNLVLHGTYPAPVEATKSYHLAHYAIQWLEWNDDPRPWMLRVSLDDPHPPVVPPEPFASMYDPADIPSDLVDAMRESLAQKPQTVRDYARLHGDTLITEDDHRRHAARYMGFVTHLDAQFGRVLHHLEATGEDGNTLVLFNSDHGHMIGEHGLACKGPLFYDGTCAIPTVLRWPGRITPGTRTDALVHGIDLAPTLCDLLEIPVPDDHVFDGESWRPLIEGRKKQIRDHTFLQFEDFGFAVVDGRYKLCHWDSDPEGANGELYDLQTDRYEKRNRYNDPDLASIRAGLTAHLKAWRTHHARPQDHPHPEIWEIGGQS